MEALISAESDSEQMVMACPNLHLYDNPPDFASVVDEEKNTSDLLLSPAMGSAASDNLTERLKHVSPTKLDHALSDVVGSSEARLEAVDASGTVMSEDRELIIPVEVEPLGLRESTWGGQQQPTTNELQFESQEFINDLIVPTNTTACGVLEATWGVPAVDDDGCRDSSLPSSSDSFEATFRKAAKMLGSVTTSRSPSPITDEAGEVIEDFTTPDDPVNLDDVVAAQSEGKTTPPSPRRSTAF